LAKEIKQLGQGTSKKSDKKQIISNDLHKTFGKSRSVIGRTLGMY
jgi:hypothetical protein